MVRLDQAALATVLGRQNGVISRAQAAACGMTVGALRHRLRPGGPWQSLLPGVYLAQTGAPQAQQHQMAALLLAGPDSVLTGACALSRHGFRVQPPVLMDVLVPASRIRRDAGFTRIRRTTRLPPGICTAGEIRYAPVPRAVADAVRWGSKDREARAIVAEAVQQGYCPLPLLAEELDAGPVRGSARLRRVLAEVTGGIRSVAEARLPGADQAGPAARPGAQPATLRGGYVHRRTGLLVAGGWGRGGGGLPRMAPRPG